MAATHAANEAKAELQAALTELQRAGALEAQVRSSRGLTLLTLLEGCMAAALLQGASPLHN
jgi:hypothetical protein